MLNLAFIFLLLGYGTKAGLVPLHAWLPDAHAEGPTPISAVLSGLLLNAALYAVLRSAMLMSANPAALTPPLLVGVGGNVAVCGLDDFNGAATSNGYSLIPRLSIWALLLSLLAWADHLPILLIAAHDHA